MALSVTKMARIFQFAGIRLPDPNEAMSVDEVKALYAAQYPELATAVVNGPEAVGDKMRYTFERAIGSKGLLPVDWITTVIARQDHLLREKLRRTCSPSLAQRPIPPMCH